MNATENEPVALRTALQIEVNVSAPIALGELDGMERRMIPILGGKLTGPDFSGTILPGGSDVQSVRPDGTIDLLARYAVDLGANGKLLIENTGIRRLTKSGEVDAAPYFRGVMRFCAPPGSLQWLNDSVFISNGYRQGSTVYLDVMEVL
jgi:hypothetical protein